MNQARYKIIGGDQIGPHHYTTQYLIDTENPDLIGIPLSTVMDNFEDMQRRLLDVQEKLVTIEQVINGPNPTPVARDFTTSGLIGAHPQVVTADRLTIGNNEPNQILIFDYKEKPEIVFKDTSLYEKQKV